MRSALLLSLGIWGGVVAPLPAARYEAQGADDVRYRITRNSEGLDILVLGAGVDRPDQTVFVALGRQGGGGSSLVPAGKDAEGSAVWLPFPADLLLAARSLTVGEEKTLRRWEKTHWGEREKAGAAFSVETEPAQLLLRIPAKLLGRDDRINLAVYLKDLAADGGMGRLYGALDPATLSGTGERTIRHYLAMEKGKSGTTFLRAGRTDPAAPKVRIYQMLPRLFGNTNETRQANGLITENGSGKFGDLNEAALAELAAMGFTHIWVTGVLQQATATDYADIGEPADDPDLLKGVAGSPYAIRDYFDVSPDYADDPAKRMEEFKALVGRVHEQGMKVLIDFVPNHVARSHHSTVRPELSFGANDDRGEFFDPENNFYYLTGDAVAEGEGPPLRLPTVDGDGRATSPTVLAVGGGDGLFEAEKETGRVTGNNIISWSPGQDTWYETVKLNYGYDFTQTGKDARKYPHASAPELPVPDTWKKMDEVIAYWQEAGVDGFRADMAHMVPPEFWRWLIERSRGRQPHVYWMAEAYDTDPARVPGGDPAVAEVTEGEVMPELLDAGFDAVYDDMTYDALKEVYDGSGTANDLDRVRPREFFFDNALRYAENHDEVRLAGASQWGGAGMQVGRPVSALLFGLSRGPVMVYHGQEVGEPAEGIEGFGRDDARTTIYDYWSMPEFAKWVNGGTFDGGRLSDEQKALRDFYRRLLAAVDQPAFRDGDFYPLNPDNLENPDYGRLDGGVSGHWLYSYLRHDPVSGQRMLVVVNLHPTRILHDVRIRFPRQAMRFLDWDTIAGSATVPVIARDRLGDVPGEAAEILTAPAEMERPGLPIKELQPLGAAYYELSTPADG
jgi:glycosidase